MPLFLRLGSVWINVNHIQMVRLLPSSGPDKAVYEVRFIHGGTEKFGAEDGETLLDFLSQHPAVPSL